MHRWLLAGSDILTGSCVLTGSLLLSGAIAVAEPVPLRGEAIRQAVVGRVVDLDTPIGIKLPITFKEDGSLQGSAGALAFYLGTLTDTGRWWVAGHRLCQQWTKWLDGEKQCLKLAQDGRRLHWIRDDGRTGTATITPNLTPVGNVKLATLGGPDAIGPQAAFALKNSAPAKVPAAVASVVQPVRRQSPADHGRSAALQAMAGPDGPQRWAVARRAPAWRAPLLGEVRRGAGMQAAREHQWCQPPPGLHEQQSWERPYLMAAALAPYQPQTPYARSGGCWTLHPVLPGLARQGIVLLETVPAPAPRQVALGVNRTQ